MRNRINLDPSRTVEFSSVGELLEVDKIANGQIVVHHNRQFLDFELADAPADTVVVEFHGALTREVEWPVLVGDGVTWGLENTARLSIADPSVGMYDTLALAWYAGSQQMPDLQKSLATLVDKIASLAGAKHLVFFGSSGGGFAALQMSRHFPGSIALVMNPQTSIGQYQPGPVNGYLRRCWDDMPVDDLPVEHDLTVSYADGHENTIAYVQNTRDTSHVEHHRQRFFDALPSTNGVWCLSDAWGTDPKAVHVPPPKRLIKEFLAHVTSCDGDWPTGLERFGFTHAAETEPLVVS